MRYIKPLDRFILNESNENYIENPEFEKITDNEEVVIVQGRFQPFHKGHMKMIRNASKIFDGKKVFVIQIKSDSEKSPFPEEVIERIREEVIKNEPCIEKYTIFRYDNDHRAVLGNLVRYVRGHGYEPIGQACGKDREKNYNKLLDYVKSDKSETKVKDKFCIKVSDDRTEGYSGTKVREAIENNNFDEYKEMMPEYLWDFFDELRKYC